MSNCLSIIEVNSIELFKSYAALIATCVGGIWALILYSKNNKLKRTEWLHSLFQKFYSESKYLEIRGILDYRDRDKLSALNATCRYHNDRALEEKLVDYLNFFEFISTLKKQGQLKKKEILMMFEYYLRLINKYAFLMDYLKIEGFEELHALLRDLHKDDYLFVYGTLKSDVDNEMAKFLLKNAEYIGRNRFQGRLYKVDDYPGAVSSSDPNDMVYGELYKLKRDDKILEKLDEYEECSRAYSFPTEYVRERLDVVNADGKIIRAWVYLYNRPVDNLSQIPSGTF